MDDKLRETLKTDVGITDADLARLSLRAQQILAKLIATRPFKVVAEVTEAQYCSARIAVGQKLVFDQAVLNGEQSTAAPCIWALGPLAEAVTAVISGGLDGAVPERTVAAYAECGDQGLENGGLGKVKFQLSWHRVRSGEAG